MPTFVNIDRKAILCTVAGCLIGVTVGLAASGRYKITGTMRVDQWTGKTWIRSGYSWVPMDEMDIQQFKASDFEPEKK